MKKLTFTLLVLLALVAIPINSTAHACTIPTITIRGVTEDTSVTVETHDFPANREFEVRMGLIGAKGMNGILIGAVDSGPGGSLAFTFAIPDSLRTEDLIAIRLDSTTGGYYAFNWFTNTTFGTHESAYPVGKVEVWPIISVVSVKEGSLVTVKGSSFPENEDIIILMGEYGTEGIDGVAISSINAGGNGMFIKTFNIPERLHSESKIAIRFELSSSDVAIHDWFENRTGGCGSGSVNVICDGYTGIPTITILSVNEGEDVTIRTNNFPADMDFKVLMGKIGTKGVAGTLITTIDSGEGGSFTASFDIPDSLTEDYQVAIRLQTENGVFYAYNWFYNTTSP